MAVWLKSGPQELAFDHDIVPREAMCTLVDLQLLEEEAQKDLAERVRQTRAEQEDTLARAREEAEAIGVAARSAAAASARLGYAQGRRDGLRQWHSEASARRAASRARYIASRDALADLVVQATSALIQGPVMAAYLQKALQALDALAEKDLTLTVHIHPGDRAVVEEAIERMRPQWRDGTILKLLVSDALEPGSCVCESPGAYMDASLSLHLASLRGAARGALESLALPDETPGKEPESAPDEPLSPTHDAAAGPAGGETPAGQPSGSYRTDSLMPSAGRSPTAAEGGAERADTDDEDKPDDDFYDEYSTDDSLWNNERPRW